jgi:hypothetical protein
MVRVGVAGCTSLVIASCTPSPTPTNPAAPSFEDASPSEAGTRAAPDATTPPAVGASVDAAVDANPERSVAIPPHADAGAHAAVLSIATSARPPAGGPAHEGEVCEAHSMAPLPEAPIHRPCAPGLVCCVPPHGAVMQVETAICRVPCKPTPPSAQPQVAGCSGNGCPWALVP